jgi:hypothetical protein
MSHKRSKAQETENQQWIAKHQRERDEAVRKAEEQRRNQPVPGYRRMPLEEDF